MSTVVNMESAALMDRYYDRRALSSISETPFFHFTDAVWGNGFISYNENGKPVVDEIPLTVTEIQGEFHRSKPALSYLNGAITVRATIPVGGLENDANEEFSALYLLDDEQGIIAVFAITPMWLNARKSLVVEGILEIGKE